MLDPVCDETAKGASYGGKPEPKGHLRGSVSSYLSIAHQQADAHSQPCLMFCIEERWRRQSASSPALGIVNLTIVQRNCGAKAGFEEAQEHSRCYEAGRIIRGRLFHSVPVRTASGRIHCSPYHERRHRPPSDGGGRHEETRFYELRAEVAGELEDDL